MGIVMTVNEVMMMQIGIGFLTKIAVVNNVAE